MKKIKILSTQIRALLCSDSFYTIAIMSCLVSLGACQQHKNSSVNDTTLTPEQKEILAYLPKNLVIAHRGTTYWAPEETEAAMRWARNTGAHYLEFDLQRTKDGYLIALHDEKLVRTTDVTMKFPSKQEQPVSEFTYEELMTLDAGSWFNDANPDRARTGFVGADILTLEDVIKIAEGYRIKRDENGRRVFTKNTLGKIETQYEIDSTDNGNRPGIYVETKIPALFDGIEENLRDELIRLGWYNVDTKKMKTILTTKGKVQIGNSKARVILQTFSKESLSKLKTTFVRPIPTCFLLWRGSDLDDLPDDGMDSYKAWVKYGKANGATIIGPSIAGIPNNYHDLLTPAHAKYIRNEGLAIHAYSFDNQEQMEQYGNRVDGMFTNRADATLLLYEKTTPTTNTPDKVLNELGYIK